MLLALLVEGLIALAFLALSPRLEPEKHEKDPVVFGITADKMWRLDPTGNGSVSWPVKHALSFTKPVISMFFQSFAACM